MAYSTIPYPSRDILHQESITRQPYVGFVCPNGTLIDFDNPIGKNMHDATGNPLSNIFLKYISYVNGTEAHEQDFLKKYNPEIVTMKQVDGYDELIFRGWFGGHDGFQNFNHILSNLEYDINRLKRIANHMIFSPSQIGEFAFQFALLNFFKDAYQDKDFFRTIGRVIRIPNKEYIKASLREKHNPEWLNDYEEKLINAEVEKYLMSYFKDICVMYLGHDSVETFQPNGEQVIRMRYNGDPDDCIVVPRIITSARPDIHETYFNCLIMDWIVHRIPRFTKDNWGIYTQQSEMWDYYETSREREFKEEIVKIKKMVSLKDRPNYFIKP